MAVTEDSTCRLGMAPKNCEKLVLGSKVTLKLLFTINSLPTRNISCYGYQSLLTLIKTIAGLNIASVIKNNRWPQQGIWRVVVGW